MDSDTYESHLVGRFMQIWGRLEGVGSEPAVILNNAQNPFDNWFGDICGKVQFRYFLIEFKKTREGFLDEVRIGSQKPNRTALYEHLKTDVDCRKIACFGHFAAYAHSNSDLLAFEPYLNSAAPVRSKSQLVDYGLNSTGSSSELNHRTWALDFKRFYDALHEKDLSLYHNGAPWLFSKGLGIPVADLEQYVSCMYSHLIYHAPTPGIMLLGAFNPSTGEFKSVALSPFQMLSTLKDKFEKMEREMAEEQQNLTRTKNAFRDQP